MPEELTWDDADEIALVLRDRFPDTNPDQASDLEITRWVREIPLLRGEPPAAVLPDYLEAIRDAWRAGR